MGCVYSNSIGIYLDNEMTVNERVNLQAHIENCPQCQAELGLLKLTSEFIGENKVEVNAVNFLANLRNRINEDKRISRENKVIINDFGKWSKRFIPLPFALALACWLLLITYVNKNNPVEEYIFGRDLSDISSLIDQPGSNLG